MPSSSWVHISDVCDVTVKQNPNKILDVGAGFGRWGNLFRELLDIGKRRWDFSEWKVGIHAIEPFYPYLKRLQDNGYYDALYHCTLKEWLTNPDNFHSQYDLIMLGDMLEHMTREEVEETVARLLECNLAPKGLMIIAMPTGEGWKQGEVNSNPLEEHKYVWRSMGNFVETLWGNIRFRYAIKTYSAFSKPYELLLIWKSHPAYRPPAGFSPIV